MTAPTLRVLSLGGGVQSTTLALMAAAGEISAPMPDAAIFADTGWEPDAVYEHLRLLRLALPFPILTVSAGNIRADILASASSRCGRFAAVPWYLRQPDGSAGMGRRQCTAHYKVEPIRRAVRRMLCGNPPERRPRPGAVEMWLGISRDEAARMKPSGVRYIEHRWPLIEAGMSRADCLGWLARRGWSAPKSACIGCPYRSDAMWREMRDQRPAEWADAVAADRAIRTGGHARGIRGEQFMHRSMVPLDQVVLSAEDRGQLNLFNAECEGVCAT